MGGPFLIYDVNVASSSHGPQGSSLPPCNFDPSNVDHDDDVMFLDESDPTPKTNILIVPSKLIVQKKNYDALRKFQDSWATKPPWIELCLSSNGSIHTVKCKMCSEVEGKDKIFIVKWDSLCKHVGWKKAKKNIGTNVIKGDWYHFKDASMPRTINCLFLTTKEMLVPNLQMGWQERT